MVNVGTECHSQRRNKVLAACSHCVHGQDGKITSVLLASHSGFSLAFLYIRPKLMSQPEVG